MFMLLEMLLIQIVQAKLRIVFTTVYFRTIF